MSNIQNEELVKKAVIVADDLASNGKLNDAQSNKFIDYVVDETVLKDNARIIRFRNENLDIDKIGIGARAAVPKSEAKDPGVRRGINTSKVTLTPKEIMVPIEIGDNFSEINIEGEAVEDHIIQMFAKQMANDIEELYLLGDVLGPAVIENDIYPGGSTTQYIKDTYLALFNGWQNLAEGGNLYNAQAANIGTSVFGAMLRQMPTKFRRNKSALRWLMSPDLSQLYTERLATRATAAGDAAIAGNQITPFGIPIVEVPLWDLNPLVVEHVTLNGTTAVALKNLNVTNLVVHPETLDKTPTTAYIETTDYVIASTAVADTIARTGGGAIGDGDTVKVTYHAKPQCILTHMMNLIVGIGRDIRIEKDRDIYAGVNQYAITAKVSANYEELSAMVKGKNIGDSV
jgi:hypothetical protein